MITLHGKGVVQGIAFGTISFVNKNENTVNKVNVPDFELEITRFDSAKVKAIEKLKQLYEKAVFEVGEANAMIFEIHEMMLEDPDYYGSIYNIIRTQRVNAEFAVLETSKNFSQMFASMEDKYMQARAADVKDVSERLLEILSGKEANLEQFKNGSIIAADDLAPSETIQLDKSKILAFLTRRGSSNSHTSILARTMDIPAIVDIGDSLKEEYNLMEAIVDGDTGVIYIDPDNETKSIMKDKKQEFDRRKLVLTEMMGKESVSKDGQKVKLYANISGVEDIENVINNDAEGVGLFRSEFLYLQSPDYPSEEEQFQAYRTVAKKMNGKPVIFRTLDVGADKQIDYFSLPKEENPAMGFRAIRICLSKPQIFKTQLRALYRASAFGKIAVMFPMIISVGEVKSIKEMAKEVKDDLRSSNIGFDEDMELGIMIETPAAAIMSDKLAKEVDFFSIGTNDLTQYTLAIDRQNQLLDKFYNPYHPAVLRLIKTVADNAHKNGIWVGICGELGSDPQLTETFLSMGIDELSVSPSRILPLRQKVRQTDVSLVKEKCLSKFNQM